MSQSGIFARLTDHKHYRIHVDQNRVNLTAYDFDGTLGMLPNCMDRDFDSAFQARQFLKGRKYVFIPDTEVRLGVKYQTLKDACDSCIPTGNMQCDGYRCKIVVWKSTVITYKLSEDGRILEVHHRQV